MGNAQTLTDADTTIDHPQIRKISYADVIDALWLGLEDFRQKPSHYVFMCLIYPVVGIVILTWASGGNALQLVYPMMAGFALLGPFAAIGLYEISRRRELDMDASWRHAFEVLRAPSLRSILAVGGMLVVLFVVWMYAAQAIYQSIFGATAPASAAAFLGDVLTTPQGWALILVGNAAGFVFAVIALCISVVAFPLLLDRNIGAHVAVETSMRAVAANPLPMILWGLIVAVALLIASILFLIGLAIVMPILGHATWHLYRRVVEPAAGQERAA
ncbi:DUF2189 domain-containing protein [Hoeflea prorocentri]|uniref:DUF2189 domain-containing protein n=1 Tax=Hoeflea prorocentri TaxID=1922333 RepID=A0A9X3ZGX0_9HYPH|nr:DUF2189 domain-containing protein [Hoeflea prorocentri]MCY6381207.1 DUF2189 domain-containing protein [Hoeflea prorocentri]MDA5399007.1 DUF2189 domain-containing protein [Hoeflea prorocentri]